MVLISTSARFVEYCGASGSELRGERFEATRKGIRGIGCRGVVG